MVDCACDLQLNFKKLIGLLITIEVVEVFQKTQEVVHTSSVKKNCGEFFYSFWNELTEVKLRRFVHVIYFKGLCTLFVERSSYLAHVFVMFFNLNLTNVSFSL